MTRRQRVTGVDWAAISVDLDAQGWAVLPGLIGEGEGSGIIGMYDGGKGFRSHVVMARHGFGQGEYRYFAYPLPDLVQELRAELYPHLVPIANRWHERMGRETRFPADHAAFLERCHEAGQARPTPLLLQYGAGDYNCLHQDLYGEHVFPLQVATLLSQPGKDFEGGEFVMTEQRPRMQTRASVVPLTKGDAVLFAVNSRPSGVPVATTRSSSATASASCARAVATRSASSSTTPPDRNGSVTAIWDCALASSAAIVMKDEDLA